jgi:hypothetical protein
VSEKTERLRSTKAPLPENYAKRLLLLMIEGLNAGRSYADLAHCLNTHGLKTPTGRDWAVTSIKEHLKCIRQPTRYPSKLAAALHDLIARNQLTADETAPLYELRVV